MECPACGAEVGDDEERHETPTGERCPVTLDDILDEEASNDLLLLYGDDDE